VTKTAERERAKTGPTSYRADVSAWAYEQAGLLRSGAFDRLDIEKVAEELESLGKSEFQSLTSSLTRLLQHMLKWDFQPEKRTRSWATSIRVHRKHVARTLQRNPSLKPRRDEAVKDAYDVAVEYAADETGLATGELPRTCPYDWAEIMEREFELKP